MTGRQADYFAYFYDRLSAKPGAVSARARQLYAEAYRRPEALRAGFDWYRAFQQDEKNNLAVERQPVDTPVLYLRGDKDPGLGLDRYLDGLRHAGLRDIQAGTIANIGTLAAAFGKPVLLLEGDSHRFEIQNPFSASSPLRLVHPGTPVAENVTRLVVEGSDGRTEYVRLTIDPRTAGLFSWERVPLQ